MCLLNIPLLRILRQTPGAYRRVTEDHCRDGSHREGPTTSVEDQWRDRQRNAGVHINHALQRQWWRPGIRSTRIKGTIHGHGSPWCRHRWLASPEWSLSDVRQWWRNGGQWQPWVIPVLLLHLYKLMPPSYVNNLIGLQLPHTSISKLLSSRTWSWHKICWDDSAAGLPNKRNKWTALIHHHPSPKNTILRSSILRCFHSLKIKSR